jgi:hypothetical protein
VGDFAVLTGFRTEFFRCLTRRRDALFELCDAALCADGPVRSLVDLALVPEHQRGHGALYDAVNHGGLDEQRLLDALTRLPLPRTGDGRLVLAIDVSPWLRPDGNTCPDRSFCHTYGRRQNEHRMIPGWPYSFVVALETGRSSWTAILDTQRVPPGADLAQLTIDQIRAVAKRLIAAGHWHEGDPDVLVVLDAGYDAPRIAWQLRDLPIEILGRMRSDRVLRRPTPPRTYDPKGGRPPKHGAEFVFGDPTTWNAARIDAPHDARLYGRMQIRAWDRLHPRLTRRCAWIDHEGALPVIEGTVIRLDVEHLPRGGEPKPVWLWWSKTDPTPDEVDLAWQAFLRRFDIEHTFRMLKQTLGWTRPKLRDPEAADRWTWLVIAAHTQLRLGRPLTKDLRHPWEKPLEPAKHTPARVRRGFRNLRARMPPITGAPKPTAPGPGRPTGSRNKHVAARFNVGLELVGRGPYQAPTHHEKGTKPSRKG